MPDEAPVTIAILLFVFILSFLSVLLGRWNSTRAGGTLAAVVMLSRFLSIPMSPFGYLYDNFRVGDTQRVWSQGDRPHVMTGDRLQDGEAVVEDDEAVLPFPEW